MAEAKDTIYIDIDDDITAMIDKLTDSSSKIVALVLPKRATVLQSQVNMKLLKRAADDAGKNLVLITSESDLAPLAAAAGVYVARTLSSKPEIPKPATIDEDEIENLEETDSLPATDFDARGAEDTPIGEIAGGSQLADDDLLESDTIELDNSDEKPLAVIDKTEPKSKKGKDRSKRIPNFGRFRNYALLVVLALVGLGVLFYFALVVWPHATIKIYTEQTQVPASFTATLNPSASKADPSTDTIPAVAETQQKSYSQTVPATGQKDEGTPASGSVTLTNCSQDGSSVTIPAGTGVSTNNLTFITQSSITLISSSFDFKGNCKSVSGYSSGTVQITAQNSGTNYNVSQATFQVSGYSAVNASGSASGGTSNIVQVVQQSDIDSAKSKLNSQDTASIKQALLSQISNAGLTPMPQTFTVLPSDVQTSANAGDQANNVTVTENVIYLMYGYHPSDLDQLVKAAVASQLSSDQGVLDYGLGAASFKLNGTPSTTTASVNINSTVTIGPNLDVATIKKQVAGKRAGDVRSQLSGKTGISKVGVDTSPFWVGSVPGNTSKIKVEFIKTGSNG